MVFDQGKLIEEGSHEELLKLNGRYHFLYQKQNGIQLSETGHRVTIAPEWLGTLPVFEHLPQELLVEISELMIPERFAEDKIVVAEGELGDKVYVVAHGKLQVSSQRSEMSAQVLYMEDGDYFGEIALLSNVLRTATVRTVVPTILLSLSKTEFEKLLLNDPETRFRLEKVAEERLKRL